jgi:CBS domain-containing protein
MKMRIKEVMNHPVITCPTGSTLDHAARLMWEFDCGVIPVVNNEGRLSGIVTDRDICMAAYTQGKALQAISVETAMATDVAFAHPDDGIETLEDVMRERRIRRVPVVDAEHRPVGMVSVNDLARLAAQAKKLGVEHEVVRTLADVSRPRGHAVHLVAS